MLHTKLPTVSIALGLVIIAAVTLAPAAPSESEGVATCILCGTAAVADLLVNILLYVPFGIGLGGSRVGVRRALLTGALLSATIEAAQLILPGRDASLGDALANTVGTGIGWAIARSAPTWLQPPARLRGRLTAASAAGVCSVFAATALLLQPSFPHTQYYSMWAPNLGHLEWYRGRVQEVTLAGEEVPARRVGDSETLRQRFLHRDSLVVQVAAGPATSRISAIFAVYDSLQQEIVLLGPDEGDLVWRYRTRAADLRLDQPDLRWRGVLRGVSEGEALSLAVVRGSDGYSLSLGGMAPQIAGYTLGRGWGLLYYAESFPPWVMGTLDAVWMASLLIPLGFWGRGWRTLAPGFLVVVAGYATVTASSLLSPSTLTEWIGGSAGLAVGILLRRRIQDGD